MKCFVFLPGSLEVFVAEETFAGFVADVATRSAAVVPGTAAYRRYSSTQQQPPPYPGQLALYCDAAMLVDCGGQPGRRQKRKEKPNSNEC